MGRDAEVVERRLNQRQPRGLRNPEGHWTEKKAENTQQASENGEMTALIFLHGLGTSATNACNWFISPALGLSSSMNMVRCTKGPTKPIKIFPVTFLPGSDRFVSSWCDFFLLPGSPVLAPACCPGETRSTWRRPWIRSRGSWKS